MHGIHDLVAGKDAAGLAGEQLEHLEFGESQLNIRAVNLDLVATDVD